MPYLLCLKKKNRIVLKLSSAANYRWRFKGSMLHLHLLYLFVHLGKRMGKAEDFRQEELPW